MMRGSTSRSSVSGFEKDVPIVAVAAVVAAAALSTWPQPDQ